MKCSSILCFSHVQSFIRKSFVNKDFEKDSWWVTSSTQFLILKIIHVELSKEFIHLKCNENILAGNYMFKVNNRNTRTWCEICSCKCVKFCLYYIWCWGARGRVKSSRPARSDRTGRFNFVCLNLKGFF